MYLVIVLLVASSNSVSAAVPQERRQTASAGIAPKSGCFSDNPEALYDASCWAALNLTNWLNEWHEPRVCGAQDFGVNCCGPHEEWSTCFLRLGKHDGGFNCSQIQVNTNNCVYNKDLSPTLTPEILPQVRYILRTIFNVAAFFNDWYLALQFASTQAALTIEAIVTTIAPPKGLSITETDLLSGLIAGLPFFGSPVFAKAIDASKASQALVTGLQQAPGLVKALFPTSGPDAQNIQIASVSTVLKGSTDEISKRINAGLWTLMSDKAAFAAFASSGAFSSDPALSIPQQAAQLSAGLTLLILTTVLAGNDYDLQFYDPPNIGASLCPGEDGLTCYHSDTFLGGTTAFIGKTNSNDLAPGMLQKFVENKWIASEASLFESGVNCAASGQFGKAVVGVNADGTFNVDCLNRITSCRSNPPLRLACLRPAEDYTWCSFNGGACPLGDCWRRTPGDDDQRLPCSL